MHGDHGAKVSKPPPLHAGSAHEQSRAEVPSKYVPSTRGVSHTKARSEKPNECQAAECEDTTPGVKQLLPDRLRTRLNFSLHIPGPHFYQPDSPSCSASTSR